MSEITAFLDLCKNAPPDSVDLVELVSVVTALQLKGESDADWRQQHLTPSLRKALLSKVLFFMDSPLRDLANITFCMVRAPRLNALTVDLYEPRFRG